MNEKKNQQLLKNTINYKTLGPVARGCLAPF